MFAPFRSRWRAHQALALLVCFGLGGVAAAQNIQGAIYTSDATGTTVNGNNYASKLDVYLNGGPQNCIAPGLPPDDYYYMVTNPSGSLLLSLDPVADRKFRVTAASSGKIAENLGNTTTHPNGTSPCAGGISIRLAKDLADFANTDNPGGVYKAWITRASDFDALCDGSKSCELNAFVHSNTKTDNFKVNGEQAYNGALTVYKFYDANANGEYDVGIDIDLPDWLMTLTSTNQGVDSSMTTGADGTATWDPLVPDIDYFVTEGTPVQGNWVHSATIYEGHDGSPQNPAGPLAVTGGQTTLVAFGNYCTIPSNGKTLGFWSNKNGQAKVGADDLAMLVALNLRNADGTHFNPANYTAFRTWLLGASATNMANMLSAQLAAMELNVFNGIVNGNAYYVPAGKTINQIMAEADASLGLYGLTLSGHPQRANQEQLKNWLDALNNGAGVLSTTPCKYSF